MYASKHDTSNMVSIYFEYVSSLFRVGHPHKKATSQISTALFCMGDPARWLSVQNSEELSIALTGLDVSSKSKWITTASDSMPLWIMESLQFWK
jgi:hypothetical protein